MSDINKSRISEIILSSLRDLIAEKKEDEKVEVSETTDLYGRNSNLDSLGLVTLLLDIEQKINEAFDVLIALTDERAMSQKHSPFRTVQTLVQYISMLVEEQNE